MEIGTAARTATVATDEEEATLVIKGVVNEDQVLMGNA